MEGTGTELFQRADMFPGPVTLVADKTVAGVIPVIRHHQAVPSYLGDNRRRGDGDTLVFSSNQLLLTDLHPGNSQPINQQKSRRNREFLKSKFHRPDGGLQNINPVDLDMIYYPYPYFDPAEAA